MAPEGSSSPFPLDPTRYAPKFTEEDEEKARSEGCCDAAEAEMWKINTDLFIYAHEDMHRKARAAFRRDLESIGVPPESLGAIAAAARKMPGSPDYEPPTEIHPPRNPVIRDAAVLGMRDRLVRLHKTLEDKGIPHGVSPDTDDYPWERHGDVDHLYRQREEIRDRLAAYGVDIQAVEATISPGEEPRSEFWVPEDSGAKASPELQRVLAEWEADKARYYVEHDDDPIESPENAEEDDE
jgi:hypothetical protein